MFYCDACAKARSWPETTFKSAGMCELCRKAAACNDMPSKDLPDPVDPDEQARIEVEKLEAGPELDSEVAEKLMGLVTVGQGHVPLSGHYQAVPKYSTEMSSAWEVVQKLRSQGINLWSLGEHKDEDGHYWQADFGRDFNSDRYAFAPTPELAICRAALLWATECATK